MIRLEKEEINITLNPVDAILEELDTIETSAQRVKQELGNPYCSKNTMNYELGKIVGKVESLRNLFK